MNIALGDRLIKEGLITADQRNEALQWQMANGGRLGEGLVELGFISAADFDRAMHRMPMPPHTVADTELPELFLIELMLKIAFFSGKDQTLMELARRLHLPLSVVDELASKATKDFLFEIRSVTGFIGNNYNYALTDRGRQRAERALDLSSYAGPAPVSFRSYRDQVLVQSVRQVEVDAPQIRQALQHLVIGEDLLDRIGPAFNSGRSIFIYGPPGSGKSSIAEALGRSLPGSVYVPHAILVDGQVIRVFDPTVHTTLAPDADEAERGIDTALKARHDLRWEACRRPVVMVGGELTMSSLELEYDTISKFYEAPAHMKAANGMFIIDDFGRQQIPVRQLLNRWIVPLERGADFLELHTGKKLEIPFDQITVFATNLNPAELLDQAFLRRMRHKIKVPNQTEAEFIENLQRVCVSKGIEFRTEMAAYLIDQYYKKENREFAGSHPRDLIEQIIDRARFRREIPAMSQVAIDAAVTNYFVHT